MQAGIWLQWEMHQIPQITCLRRQCIPVGRREIRAYSLFGYLRFKSGELFFYCVFFFLHGFSSNHLIICNMFYSENCELLMVLVTIELNASRQKWGHLMFPFPSAWFHTVAAHQPRFWNEADVERVSDEPTRRAIEQKQVLNWLESLPLSSSLLLNPASMFWLAQSMSPLYMRKLKLR